MKSVIAAVTGTYHNFKQLPCQDAVFSMPNAVVLCDGAGSVEHSEMISDAIGWHFVNSFNDEFDYWYSLSNEELQSNIHRKAAELTRVYLDRQADCTFLAFAENGDRNFLIHVGDGFVFGIDDEEATVLSFPENGKELNTTYFLSCRNYKKHIRILRDVPADYHTLILCSDGASEVLYNRKEKKCARAVRIMSSWMDSDDLSAVKDKLYNALNDVFRLQSHDDMSACLIRREPVPDETEE